MSRSSQQWDTAYEWKTVTLLGVGFGLVGLDRWIIAPLLPSIAADLGLTVPQQLNLVATLGLVWGVFALFSGMLADKIGHRKILIPALFLFSMMSGASGLAVGYLSLLSVRGLMGMMEGSYCPTSFAATAAASAPKRRGFNQGLQQCGFALFGFGLGPIIATQLLRVVPSWRQVLWVVAIPGIITGVLLYFVLREPKDTPGGAAIGAASSGKGGGSGFGQVLKSKNILLSMLALMCAMACIFVLGGVVPEYLTGYLKLSTQQMGFVMSALGFGGCIGQFGIPGISDFLGRRTTATLSFIGAALTVWWFMQLGPNSTMLFLVLFLVSFFSLGNVALITGPIATESAPVGLISSAIGLVVASGEIMGGGIAPFIAGQIGGASGIQSTLYMPLIGVGLGALVSLFLSETAPAKVGKLAAAAAK